MQETDKQTLRELVRNTIREALAEMRLAPGEEAVSFNTDADLHAFIRRIVALMDDPRAAADLRRGRFPFHLQKATTGSAQHTHDPVKATDKPPIIGERVINELGNGSELVLVPGTIVTPMARDRARERSVKLVWRQ